MNYNPLDYRGKSVADVYATAEQADQMLPEYNANVLPGFELQPGDLGRRYMEGFYSYIGDSLADMVKNGREAEGDRDRELISYVERLAGHKKDDTRGDFENYLDSLSQLFSE